MKLEATRSIYFFWISGWEFPKLPKQEYEVSRHGLKVIKHLRLAWAYYYLKLLNQVGIDVFLKWIHGCYVHFILVTTLKYCRQKQSDGEFIIRIRFKNLLFLDSACDLLLSGSIGFFNEL